MERAIANVLGIISGGFGVIGVVLGLVPISANDDCGSLFNHATTCDGTYSRLALVILTLGLALTFFVAAVAVPVEKPEEPPTKYPDGAQL